jgi:hypothetical protein
MRVPESAEPPTDPSMRMGSGSSNVESSDGGAPDKKLASAEKTDGPTALDSEADADFDSLIVLITSIIHPTTWDGLGGPATVVPYTVNGEEVLVISQQYPTHRAIQRLLSDLRAVKPAEERDPPTE